ncbi:hypothetical protein CASFOL_009112 [Castilleja foliolosa]|uniref:Uncharacterized protein n=1 Tax=Castilleja foliolosa TaxID=1961234 RepID=A0ABD3E4Y7_9LAMI
MDQSKNCSRELKTVYYSDIDEEMNEEEDEMEEFYALMRKMKNQLHQLQEKNMRKRAGPAGGWAPVFQLEDFTTEIEYKKHSPTMFNPVDDANNNNRKKEGKRNQVIGSSTSGLNLELKL